jgi:hypothetical protein
VNHSIRERCPRLTLLHNWSLEELIERDFAMTRHGDTQPDRGIRFRVYEEGQDVWQWAYYPKIGKRIVNRGQVKGTQQAAIAACKAAIDEWLDLITSN